MAQVLDVSVDELLQVKNDPVPKNKKGVDEIVSVAFKGVAAAMGIAAAVLALLGELDVKSGFTMLGIGLACLPVEALREKKK